MPGLFHPTPWAHNRRAAPERYCSGAAHVDSVAGRLVFHLAALTLLSWLGTFGGSGHLPAPYDSVAVAAVSLGVFVWAVHSGADHLRTAPAAAPAVPPL